MAEMLAQNSRVFADAIHKHEKSVEDVSQVKGKVADIESRLILLEPAPSVITENMQLLDGRLTFLDMSMDEKHVTETLAWCENISIKNNRKVIRRDNRENSLFTTRTIDEAISIMNESGKIRNHFPGHSRLMFGAFANTDSTTFCRRGGRGRPVIPSRGMILSSGLICLALVSVRMPWGVNSVTLSRPPECH
jgi:hypothetical protein